MAKKTNRIECNMNAKAEGKEVVFQYQEAKGDEWVVVAEEAFSLSAVQGMLYEDGDVYVSLAAYGLRAWLADRTSQFRTHGGKAVLEAMRTYYTECLLAGKWKMSRAPGSRTKVDMALVQVIVDLKGITLAQAMEAVEALPADKADLLRQRYADEYAEAQAKMSETVDLSDLL